MVQSDRTALVATLREFGLVFGYENHPEKSPAEILTKIGDTDMDVIGVTVDTGWFGTQNFDGVAALRQLAPRLKHIHLKDVTARRAEKTGYPMIDMGHETCRLGAGIVGIEACLRLSPKLAIGVQSASNTNRKSSTRAKTSKPAKLSWKPASAPASLRPTKQFFPALPLARQITPDAFDKTVLLADTTLSAADKTFATAPATFDDAATTGAGPSTVVAMADRLFSRVPATFSITDKAISITDNTICVTGKVISVTDKTICVTEKVISVTEKVISTAEIVLSKLDKVAAAAQKVLPVWDLAYCCASSLPNVVGRLCESAIIINNAPIRRIGLHFQCPNTETSSQLVLCAPKWMSGPAPNPTPATGLACRRGHVEPVETSRPLRCRVEVVDGGCRGWARHGRSDVHAQLSGIVNTSA